MAPVSIILRRTELADPHAFKSMEVPKIDDFEAFPGTLGALQRTYVTEDSALAFYLITR